MVLVQLSEFLIIGGSALGSIVVGNPPSLVVRMLKSVIGLLKPNPYSKKAYDELLKMLYDLFMDRLAGSFSSPP